METISLMGDTGLQFVDVSMNLAEDSPAMEEKGVFAEISFTGEGNTEERSLVFPGISDDGGYMDPESGDPIPESRPQPSSRRRWLAAGSARCLD